MIAKLRLLAVFSLLTLVAQPKTVADNNLPNTVGTFLPVVQPHFPDMTQNYIKTVVEPAEAARKAQAEAEAAKQAQVVYTAPVSYPQPAEGYKAFIYNMESGNNPGAVNAYSGACGLGQALPCSKMPCSLSDYACQDNFFTNYMLGRYGSWEAAYYFWQAHRWW